MGDHFADNIIVAEMRVAAVPSDKFEIPKELLWIYIITLASAIMYVVITYAITMRVRMEVFNK